MVIKITTEITVVVKAVVVAVVAVVVASILPQKKYPTLMKLMIDFHDFQAGKFYFVEPRTITKEVKQKLINEQSVIDNIGGGSF